MKKIIILFCSCIIVQAAYAQNLIVDDSLNLKRGIYKTYKEFKFNSPSVSLDCDIQAYRFRIVTFRLTDFGL